MRIVTTKHNISPCTEPIPAAACGPANVNQTVTLAGWVQKVRNLGAMTFIDLRDRYGITQIVVEEHSPAEARETACRVGREWVIQVDRQSRRARSRRTPRCRRATSRSRPMKVGDPARSRSSPLHHRGGVGRRRRPAHEVPLPRPAASAAAAQHDPAPQDGPGRSAASSTDEGFLEIETPCLVGFDARRARATSSCRAA